LIRLIFLYRRLFHSLLIGIAGRLWLDAGLDRMVPPEIAFVICGDGDHRGIVISKAIEYPLMHLIHNVPHQLREHEAERRGDEAAG